MGLGMENITTITLDNLTQIGNITTPAAFYVNVNQIIFNGYFYFILMWVLWIILFIAAQQTRDELLNNAFYSGAVVTTVSFLLRAVEVVVNGLPTGLLTDYQMWAFPVLTLMLGAIIWATKEN